MKKIILIFLLASLSTFAQESLNYEYDDSGNEYSQIATSPITADVTDSLALVSLYNATDGENWYVNTNWLSDSTLGTWAGVTLNENGKVKSLNLHFKNLIGELPQDLFNLTEIEILELSNNKLTGQLPEELGNLTNLKELNLRWNELDGAIPLEIKNLINLTRLELMSNKFSGTIPSELENLKQLEYLNLTGNEIEGVFPIELTNLTNLKFLYLDELVETIPKEIKNLTNLEELYLSGEQLEGTIPKELSELNMLKRLYITFSNIDGSIPSELGDLDELEYLALNSNRLSGNIPKEISNLSDLKGLYLYSNQLSGNIPPELGKLDKLIHFNLSGNNLEGKIPKELGNLSNLQSLYFNMNKLGGTIPEELGNATRLKYIQLQDNLFEGDIPKSFKNFTTLSKIKINNCNLSGGLENLPNSLSLIIDTVNVYNNKFEFNDFIDVNIKTKYFKYSPQDSLGSQETLLIEIGKEYTLSAKTEHIESNVYKWFKDGQLLTDKQDYELSINSAQNGDEGVYTCKITNSIVPLLTLYRRPVTLTYDKSTNVDSDIEILNGFSVFPNPANDFITLKFKNVIKSGNIQILDLLGNELLSFDIKNQYQTNIDLTSFENGYYSIIVNSNYSSYFHSLIINR